ncbi:MAG: transglycosylase SLT domain-containing protein [Burkholderiaceae bacterium]|nr:lytic transglycosylase domain-containing protein [Burkholderiales bacterium]MCZ8337511.1 transglycosylase SLT domain-containing protein [Burkholderiaceae bacterium]
MNRIDTTAAPGRFRSRAHAGIAAIIVGAIAATAAATADASTPRPCTRDCPPAAKPARAATPAPQPPRATETNGSDEAFLAARAAATRGDAARLEQLAPQVGASHPLAAYVDAWRLRLQLADYRTDTAGPLDAEARALVARHAGTLAGEIARRDWLVSLGRRQVWGTFDEAWAGLSQRDDLGLRCYALQSRAAGAEPVMAEARELLMQPRELPDACNGLLGALVANGQAGASDLWHRLEAAIESGSAVAIRRAATAAAPRLEPKQLELALSRPAAALDASPTREVVAIAIPLLARADPAEAASRLELLAPKMRPADRTFAWSQVAAAGMRRLLPESHAWAQQARGVRATDETLAWMTRAALRARDWPAVRATIERMSEAGRADPTWTYWLARALQTQGSEESQHRAKVLYTSIAGRTDFYSQLAGEELGLRVTVPEAAVPPNEAELADARANPAFARMQKFHDLGLRTEGNREWNFAVRTMGDRQLLAAAEHARRIGLLDRAVNAADRTKHEHDFTLRYPSPFADRLVPVARSQGLDPAWVYGLIRQESRFVMDARSHVGASGLMQIMPATAKWIAKKIGERDFTPSQINELDTNLRFGTFYLKTVHDDLDRSPVLASAAYNAGPGRPRSWRGTLPQPVEGAIFAEIVPFNETRGYVKHVLSNAAWYAALFTGAPQSLKAMLGEVQPGPASVSTASPGGD